MRRAEQYQQYLLKVPMFQACSKKELGLMGRLVEDCKFDAGEVLVREGERGQEFFVILEGKAHVSRAGKRVATLAPGDYFGELALLDPAPRDATVRAETAMEALVVGKREFSGLLAEVPALAHKLLVGMARRLRDADTRPCT